MDSSQRVPPMSPCPPLIITRVCPWLINHLPDPWNFNKSNGILFRSNWRKPYPKFYGLELLIIKGSSRKLARRYPPTFWGGGGLLIRCWHYIYIYSNAVKPPRTFFLRPPVACITGIPAPQEHTIPGIHAMAHIFIFLWNTWKDLALTLHEYLWSKFNTLNQEHRQYNKHSAEFCSMAVYLRQVPTTIMKHP